MNLNNSITKSISDRIKTKAIKKAHGHRDSVLHAKIIKQMIISSQ